MVDDTLVLSENFDKFLSLWSGYDAFIDSTKEKYDVDYEITLNSQDKQMWIIEAFTGNKIYTNKIEDTIDSYFNDLTNEAISYVPTIKQISSEDNDLSDIYNDIKFRYESSFAVQSVFKDTSVNLHEDVLEFNDQELLKSNIINYTKFEKLVA